MKASVAGTKLTAPTRMQARTRVTAPVAATLRQEVARVAKGTGLSLAALGLALSAQAATVKAGKDGGGLEFDPSTVTIKAGESVTWVNNVGFPHNVVFDEDEIPVSTFGTSCSSLCYTGVRTIISILPFHRRVLMSTACPTRTTSMLQDRRSLQSSPSPAHTHTTVSPTRELA